MRCSNSHRRTRKADGACYSWGDNTHGQLSQGDFGMHRQKPGRIGGALEKAFVVKVACGESHLLVLTRAGALLSCGDNSYGQLGKGDREKRRALTPVQHLTGVALRSIAAGARHSICVTVSAQCVYKNINVRKLTFVFLSFF